MRKSQVASWGILLLALLVLAYDVTATLGLIDPRKPVEFSDLLTPW